MVAGACAMYDEHRSVLRTGRTIISYSIVLMGRHRHLKVQFFYNTMSQQSFSTKKNNNLQDVLKRKFGTDALGILVDGEAWYDEDDLLRAELLPETGGYFYVLYDDSSPSYSEATLLPPAHDIPGPSLPTFQDLENDTARATLADEPRERRIHGYTYFEDIPTFTRSIALRTSDGRTKPLTLCNKDTQHIDQLNHFLSLFGGDRWIGVRVGNEEFTDDGILFCKQLKEGGTYQVSYKAPGRLNLLGRAREKKREVVYSTAVTI